MYSPTSEELLAELSLLADQLAITIDDRFDFTLTTTHSDERLLKLVMMVNFLLERARYNIQQLAASKDNLEDKIQERTALLELVIRGSSDGVWFWYIPEDRVEVSERFAQLCNQSKASIVSLEGWLQLIHEDDRDGFSEAIRRHLHGVLPSLEVRYRITDGKNHFRWVVMRGALQRDVQGNPLLLAGTQSDITPLVAVDQESSMPNEIAFVEWINLQQKHQTTAAVALISVDNFSELTDSLPAIPLKHLKLHLKKRLQQCFPITVFLAKLSNETFGVGYIGNHEQLQSYIQQLFVSFATPVEIRGHGPLKLSVSAGLLALPAKVDSNEPDSHLSALWSAVRKARESSGNSLVTFDHCLRQEQKQRLQIQSDVNLALQDERVVAFLQPIVDAQTHEITSFEALVRMRASDGSFTPPGVFIPIVEQSELIVPLTNTVLRQALSTLRQFIDDGLVAATTSVAVNIAPHHLLSGQLTALVINELSRANLAPSALKLEVTETALINNIDVAVEQLNTLRTLGCKIAIDDFGTGYSSLEYLHSLPVDVLKLDRIFVQKMSESAKTYAIARTICELASLLDLEIVAEGVEEEHEVKALTQMGATYLQGYYFCRPLPVNELIHWLSPITPTPP